MAIVPYLNFSVFFKLIKNKNITSSCLSVSLISKKVTFLDALLK